VFLNTFLSNESNLNAQQSLVTGIDMVSGMLNSILSGQQNNLNFGVNYINNQAENIDYQVYSVNAQMNLYNDKLTLKTNLGLGHDRTAENTNSFVGGGSFEWEINDNWRLNFFYVNDGNANQMSGKPEQGAGISLKFKKDFNNKKDFARRTSREKKTKKQKENILQESIYYD
jgi:hypothetical protein